MRIILEGPDGTGKTTLARQLAEKLGLKYQHEKIPLDGLKYYVNLVSNMEDNIVYDRCYLGEAIYPSVFQDTFRRDLTRGEVHMLEMALVAKGAILIKCLTSIDQEWSIIRDRGDHLITDRSMIHRVHHGYLWWFERTLLPGFIYNHTVDSLEDVLQKVSIIQATGYGPSRHPGVSGFSSGSPRMLVGESRNQGSLAFTSAVGCSAWFHELLAESGDRYYLTNSDHPTLLEEIQVVDPIEIISLGQQADFVLTELQVEHTKLPHPQYVKRFLNKFKNKIYEKLS